MRHERTVRPVRKDNGRFSLNKDGPLVWSDSLCAYGQVSGLGLSGDFLVYFEFTEKELRNWLQRYSRDEPEAALRLLGEMHAEAVIALSRKEGSA